MSLPFIAFRIVRVVYPSKHPCPSPPSISHDCCEFVCHCDHTPENSVTHPVSRETHVQSGCRKGLLTFAFRTFRVKVLNGCVSFREELRRLLFLPFVPDVSVQRTFRDGKVLRCRESQKKWWGTMEGRFPLMVSDCTDCADLVFFFEYCRTKKVCHLADLTEYRVNFLRFLLLLAQNGDLKDE